MPKTVLVSGASGLVGSRLVERLRARGDRVARLVRRRDALGPGDVFFDPEAGAIDAAALEGVDAVVHLAGESVAGGRWTEARKRRIRESRVAGTRLLAEALASRARRPSVLVSASGVGFYGPAPAGVVDEASPAGSGFLAEVCVAWEGAAQPARDAGIRVVHARFGMVLDRNGGALPAMARPIRLGVGGKLGTGSQPISFIALDDAVRALLFALDDARVRGPMNVVAPTPTTNAALTAALARALHRPAFLPVPKLALRAVLGGEMADELLLGGQAVRPRVLEELGFTWEAPALDEALTRALQARQSSS